MSKEDPLESTEDGALVLVRTGRYKEALKYLEEHLEKGNGLVSGFTCTDIDSIDNDYIIPFVAIIHHRLGHSAAAREDLAKAMSTLGSIEK